MTSKSLNRQRRKKSWLASKEQPSMNIMRNKNSLMIRCVRSLESSSLHVRRTHRSFLTTSIDHKYYLKAILPLKETEFYTRLTMKNFLSHSSCPSTYKMQKTLMSLTNHHPRSRCSRTIKACQRHPTWSSTRADLSLAFQWKSPTMVRTLTT